MEDFLTPQDAHLVLSAIRQIAEFGDVVPAWHAHAPVSRDGDIGGVREDEFGFLEFVLVSPGLGEEHPVGSLVSAGRLPSLFKLSLPSCAATVFVSEGIHKMKPEERFTCHLGHVLRSLSKCAA